MTGGRLHLAVTVAAGTVLAAGTGVVAARFAGVEVPGVPVTERTRLIAAPPGDILTHDAYTGSTYNIGVYLAVDGDDPVRVVSARARRTSEGLDQLPAALARGCDGKETWAAVVGADLARLPRTDVRPMPETTLRASDGSCWYLLLRFVPRRQARRLHAVGGEIVYRVRGREVRQRFDFRTAFEVDNDGHDPRDRTTPERGGRAR